MNNGLLQNSFEADLSTLRVLSVQKCSIDIKTTKGLLHHAYTRFHRVKKTIDLLSLYGKDKTIGNSHVRQYVFRSIKIIST